MWYHTMQQYTTIYTTTYSTIQHYIPHFSAIIHQHNGSEKVRETLEKHFLPTVITVSQKTRDGQCYSVAYNKNERILIINFEMLCIKFFLKPCSYKWMCILPKCRQTTYNKYYDEDSGTLHQLINLWHSNGYGEYFTSTYL